MLFFQSLERRSDVLQKSGLAVIGLAVAKVFLVDIGELDDLTRVFSVLFLGFELVGLAFLNRRAVAETVIIEIGISARLKYLYA